MGIYVFYSLIRNILESTEYLLFQTKRSLFGDKEMVRESRWSFSKSRYFEALRNSLPPFPPPPPPHLLSSSSVCQLVSRSTARGNDLGHGGDRSFESRHVQRKNVAKMMLDYVMSPRYEA